MTANELRSEAYHETLILTPRRYNTRLTLGSVILGDWPLTVIFAAMNAARACAYFFSYLLIKND